MVLNQNTAGYSLVDFTFALRARWSSVVLFGSILLIAGSYLTIKNPVTYEVSCSLAFSEETLQTPVFRSSTDMRPIAPDVRRQARAELMSGVLFLKVIDQYDLAERWNLKDRAEALGKMRQKIEIVHEPGSDLVLVTARDENREDSAMLANAIAMAFVDQKKLEAELKAEERIRHLKEELESRRRLVEATGELLIELNSRADARPEEAEELRQQMAQDSHLIRSLEARFQLATIEQREAQPVVSLLTKAVADEATPATPRWYLPAMLCLLGLAFGVVLVGIVAVREAPLQVAAGLRDSLDLQVVGFAPVLSAPLVRLSRIADSIVEPYRYLRQGILKLPAGDASLISFVPADRDSCLADVVTNLAVVMAEAGNTVLLIDGDLRNPQLFTLFDAANHPGLSDYLTGEMRLEETVVKSRKNNLWFMPSGPPREDPSSLFAGKRMEDLVYDMKSRFDYLFVTSPSPLAYTESGVMAGIADHTVAITSYRKHSAKALKQIRQVLESSGGLFSAVILSQSAALPIKPQSGNRLNPNQVETASSRASR